MTSWNDKLANLVDTSDWQSMVMDEDLTRLSDKQLLGWCDTLDPDEPRHPADKKLIAELQRRHLKLTKERDQPAFEFKMGAKEYGLVAAVIAVAIIGLAKSIG
jgi:hypothetical protein